MSRSWIGYVLQSSKFFFSSTNVRFCLTLKCNDHHEWRLLFYSVTVVISSETIHTWSFTIFPAIFHWFFIVNSSLDRKKNSRKFGRVSEPINVSQYERLWSLMAPVDISHQACVVKSITWACQFSMIDDFTLNVCPVCQSLPCKLQGISYIWYVAPRL